MIDSSLLDKAIIFATNAHKNVERKGKHFPYIIHIMEALSIASTMTEDQEVLSATVLHDVVEDTDYTLEDVKEEFGERVAHLVDVESDKPYGNGITTWKSKKQNSIERLKTASRDCKIAALSDKLSNMRAIARDYKLQGESFWDMFTEKDPKVHAWRYFALLDALSELKDEDAYKEFKNLVEQVFGKY